MSSTAQWPCFHPHFNIVHECPFHFSVCFRSETRRIRHKWWLQDFIENHLFKNVEINMVDQIMQLGSAHLKLRYGISLGHTLKNILNSHQQNYCWNHFSHNTLLTQPVPHLPFVAKMESELCVSKRFLKNRWWNSWKI